MKNLSNNFINVDYDADKQIVYSAWKSTTENATWEDIQNGFLNYFLKAITEFKPKFVLVDERDMSRPFSPEEQNWVDKNSAPVVIEAGIEKIAIVISKDGFVELATESMMDEGVSQGLNTQFFDSIADAEKWFLK